MNFKREGFLNSIQNDFPFEKISFKKEITLGVPANFSSPEKEKEREMKTVNKNLQIGQKTRRTCCCYVNVLC